MVLRSVLYGLCIMACAVSGRSAEWRESPEVAAIFARAGVEGTFVLYDAATGSLTGHDRDRAERRFIPASTFKIPNTLIGLSSGAVASVDEVLPYGGGPQSVKAWERDMSLRDAIVVSNVPVYQELARRIGLDAMRRYLADLEYGNADPGTEVDGFWLRGPLRISAVEQCRFLSRLALCQLPLERRAQESVHGITLIEQGDGWSLHGKTGATPAPETLGWWVGWVVKDGEAYSFALNIDMPGFKNPQARIDMGRASLAVLGILPDHTEK